MDPNSQINDLFHQMTCKYFVSALPATSYFTVDIWNVKIFIATFLKIYMT